MNDLIEHIRAAIAQGATVEQKRIGAQACRTILTALEAEPGKPIGLPGAPQPGPRSALSVDQVLDLLIARLTTVASASEAQGAQPPPAPRGLRIPTSVRTAQIGSTPANGRKP